MIDPRWSASFNSMVPVDSASTAPTDKISSIGNNESGSRKRPVEVLSSDEEEITKRVGALQEGNIPPPGRYHVAVVALHFVYVCNNKMFFSGQAIFTDPSTVTERSRAGSLHGTINQWIDGPHRTGPLNELSANERRNMSKHWREE